MSETLSKTAQKIQDLLTAHGGTHRVVQFSQSTRTAAEAAAAVGCDVGQICKSLVFKTRQTNRAVLAITSGGNRVDEKLLSEVVGEPIGKADAAFALEHTGYAIGGVPPIGLEKDLLTFIDADLLKYDEIWAAAGTPNSVFNITPQELVELSGARPATFAVQS